jgi:hypothetical protein
VFNWILATHFLAEFLLNGTIDKSYYSAPIKDEIERELQGDSFLPTEIGKICQLGYYWKCFGELIGRNLFSTIHYWCS